MASSSASSANPLFSIQVSEKLTKSNHALWKAQVLTMICGAQMEGHINGKTVSPDVEIFKKAADGKTVKTANLAYEEWFAGDKHILGFLFASVSKKVFVQIATS